MHEKIKFLQYITSGTKIKAYSVAANPPLQLSKKKNPPLHRRGCRNDF